MGSTLKTAISGSTPFSSLIVILAFVGSGCERSKIYLCVCHGCGPALTHCEVYFFLKYFFDVPQSTHYEQVNKIVKGKISVHQYIAPVSICVDSVMIDLGVSSIYTDMARTSLIKSSGSYPHRNRNFDPK